MIRVGFDVLEKVIVGSIEQVGDDMIPLPSTVPLIPPVSQYRMMLGDVSLVPWD